MLIHFWHFHRTSQPPCFLSVCVFPDLLAQHGGLKGIYHAVGGSASLEFHDPYFLLKDLQRGKPFIWIIKSVNSQISMKSISHLKSNINPVTSSSILNVPPKIPCLQVQSSLQADQTPRACREVAEGEDHLWMDHGVPRKWEVNCRKPWEKGHLILGKWQLWGFRQGTIETWPAKKGIWWDL